MEREDEGGEEGVKWGGYRAYREGRQGVGEENFFQCRVKAVGWVRG